MKQIDLDNFKICVKQAREYSYLGLYQEAHNSYNKAFDFIKQRIQKNRKTVSSKIIESYQQFYNMLKKESALNENLMNAILNLQLPQQRPQSQSQKKYPYNQKPFAFHKVHSMDQQPYVQMLSNQNVLNRNSNPLRPQIRQQQNQPPRYSDLQNYQQMPPQNLQQPYPYQQPIMQPQNPYPHMQNYQQPQPQVYKDPMVWDPPSPKKIPKKKKSKIRKNTQDNDMLNKKTDKGNKRKYDKPWQVQKKPKDSNTDKQKKYDSEFLYSVYPDGEGPDTDMIIGLESYLIEKSSQVSFNDIAGLKDAKVALKLNVIAPLKMKNYFQNIRQAPKGILLYGPAGTGKTMLAKAIASTTNTTFISILPSTLASKWRGESERMVKLIFEMARFYAPSIMFIDEIDSLLSERNSSEHEASRKVKVQFFIEIDGLTKQTSVEEEKPQIFIIGATNRPWDLDEAISRRLSKRIYIPLPDDKARKRLFELKLKGIKLSPNIDWDFMVKKTEFYNSDDIGNLCHEASIMPFKQQVHLIDDNDNEFDDLTNKLLEEEITMEHMKMALQNVKSSVNKKYLQQYEEYTKTHSSI